MRFQRALRSAATRRPSEPTASAQSSAGNPMRLTTNFVKDVPRRRRTVGGQAQIDGSSGAGMIHPLAGSALTEPS